MGQAINSALAPVGVRPFSGGPYPDAGLGDKALSAAAPLKKTGGDLLGAGETGLFDLFGINQPGKQKDNTGLGWGGVQGNTPAPPNPYGLTPTDMMRFNDAAGPINAAKKTALESATATLSKSGLSHSSAKALKQYIDQAAETELSSTYNTVVQDAFKNKLAAFLQMLQLGSGMLGQNIGATQNAAQMATQNTNQAHSDLFSAIGAGFAGANAFGGGGGGGGGNSSFNLGSIFG